MGFFVLYDMLFKGNIFYFIIGISFLEINEMEEMDN